MARMRTHTPDPGAVPAELTDPDHLVWTSLAACEALAAAYRLSVAWPALSVLRDNDLERFKAFRRAWAERNGYMSSKWPNSLDCHRLRAVGVFAGGRAPRRIGQP